MQGAINIRRESHRFDLHDSLYAVSGLKVYDGFTISDIDAFRGCVTFLNGLTLCKGEVFGDTTEEAMQRVQIRETIASHFEKERTLFEKGIKTLSLFFIDEVAHYKSYDNEGNEVKGPFWKYFEQEYNNYLSENLSLFDDDYQAYLRRFDASQVHRGYFSIDKKGHSVNSETTRGTDTSDDISAYDLILKNKERLLSFDEPTRFIFSHSALREGWDNPNVFQICTLRHADSGIAKRQEVGRGLRICVNQHGTRMDKEELGDNVHDINKLTVIANESYSTFVKGLQDETKLALRDRPVKANEEFFIGKIAYENGVSHAITRDEASSIYSYLWDNDYIDADGKISASYKQAVKDSNLEPLPKKLRDMSDSIHKLIQSIFDESADVEGMIESGYATQTPDNKLNDNFSRKEFQELWKQINHQYVYTVHYDSQELIKHAITKIDADLFVTELKYVMTTGNQENVDEFGGEATTTKTLRTVSTSTVPYDLVGEIAKRTTLTRKTAAAILRGIRPTKLAMFRNNPEEFIKKVSQLIKDEKATMIVEHIRYDKLEETYDSDIFTQEKHSQPISKSYRASKSIQDYVFTDGTAEKSVEWKFAEALDKSTEVCVYAKLPRTFKIPTPVGNYSPDWAIAFNKGTVKHIFFIAETKGSMNSMDLKPIEKAKIDCAKKLFNNMDGANVRYHNVTDFDTLLDIMKSMD